MELKDIKAIIDLMKKNSITEFELEEKDSKLRLKRGVNGVAPPPKLTIPAHSHAGSRSRTDGDAPLLRQRLWSTRVRWTSSRP